MKSSSNPPPSLPELLQRAVKALAPPIIGACLAVGMPLAAPAELSAEQKLVAQAWTTVDASYVDRTFNNQNWMGIRQKLVKAEYASREEAYQAISEELLKPLGDTYTRFITPLKYETLRKSIVDGGSGQDISGIGVTLSVDKASGKVKVVDVVEGGPAALAGLKRGSLFNEVNKVKAFVSKDAPTTAEEVAALVRGPTGTAVEVKMQDGGSEVVLSMQRAKVNVKPVTSGVNGKTGYVKIKQFDTSTPGLVKTALAANAAAGANCNVVDLRDNAGGYFRSGVDTAALFLPTGKQLVYVVNKDGVQDSFATTVDGVDITNPLFVLVNANTASASEIMTGALKDQGRGRIVGEKTFGKGVVQTVTPLADGSGIATTIARYETPNHVDINKKGIDVEADATAPMCPDPYPNL